VLPKGQWQTDILAAEFDSESALNLAEDLLVRHGTTSLVVVDLDYHNEKRKGV
jgi:hypothetical protein